MVVKPGQSPVGPSPAGESSRGKQKISDDNGVDKPTRVPGTRVQGPSRDYRYLNIPFAYKEVEEVYAAQADAQLSDGDPKSLRGKGLHRKPKAECSADRVNRPVDMSLIARQCNIELKSKLQEHGFQRL